MPFFFSKKKKFPHFARSQISMAMNDYQSYANLDNEPMHMRAFLGFHNQIVNHENNIQKEEKKQSKIILIGVF